jgi:toxin ParE1/3/4
VSAIYLVRPKADQDLDKEAFYLASEASPEVGHRFLYSAHETFGLLAAQPQMGWHARLKQPKLTDVRVFRVAGFERILVLYRPCPDGVEILRVVHGSRNVQLLLRREGVE